MLLVLLLFFAPLFGLLVAGGVAMGYQFLHVESYAREAGKSKAGGHSIRSIIAEATREPGGCYHVEAPAPPIPVFGCSLSEVEALATAWGNESRDARGHALRKDGLCLLAGVVSAPDDMDAEGWESLKANTVEWLNRDGRLLSVIEHTDESHRHFHFYKIPAPGARFETIHPGRAASEAARKTGATKGEQNRAYKKAMSRLQNDFFDEVGMFSGLTRLGPAKRRLTRSGWHQEQAAAVAASKAMATAEKQLAEARAAMGEASGAKADLASAMSEAMASLDRAKAEALAGAEKAKAEAKAAALVALAEREAAAAALASASALERKAEKRQRTLSSAWRQIGTQRAKVKAERAELEAWAGRGGRVGEFFGRLFSAASGVFSLRGMRERQLAAKLQAAQRSAAGATARAEEAEAKAKRRDWEKDALTQRHEKAVRAIDADRLKMGQELEALKKQPAGGIKPPPAKRLRS